MPTGVGLKLREDTELLQQIQALYSVGADCGLYK